jgi:O-antigen/teichoic acid export membrane protein
MIVINALSTVWLSTVFSVQSPEVRDVVLAESRDALYRLLAPVMVGMTLAAPVIMRLWTPLSFHTDSLRLVAAIIVISVFPYTAQLAATRRLLALSRTRRVAVATVVAALVNVALNFVLLRLIGLAGAALATFVAFAVMPCVMEPATLNWTGVRRHLRSARQSYVGAVLALGTIALPVGGAPMIFRLGLALLCLAWLALEYRRNRAAHVQAAALPGTV